MHAASCFTEPRRDDVEEENSVMRTSNDTEDKHRGTKKWSEVEECVVENLALLGGEQVLHCCRRHALVCSVLLCAADGVVEGGMAGGAVWWKVFGVDRSGQTAT